MDICKTCDKKHDCWSPCKKAVAWEPLEDKFYHKKYKPIGIGYLDPLGHHAKEARANGSERKGGGRGKKEETRY